MVYSEYLIMRAFFTSIKNRIVSFVKRHKVATTVGTITLLGLFVMFPHVSSASDCGLLNPADCVLDIFAWLIGDVYVPFMGKILALLTNAVVIAAGYNNFGDATAVTVGWVLTRDMANMFFVIALLLMAFGTMLNIEKLGTLHHLPHIVLYAIAVNFSKTIVLFVVDIAQVFMLTFVTAFQNTAAGNFVKAFGIEDWFKLVGSDQTDATGGVVLVALLGMILAAGLATIAVVVMAIFLGYLIWRFVYLWILIIMAPLAFGAAALGEKGHHQYAHWWKELVETIIAGPVLAFFLWLTLLIAGSSVGGSIGAEVMGGSVSYNPTVADPSAQIGGQPDDKIHSAAFSPDVLMTFVISITLLFVGLHLTEEISGGAFKAGKSLAKNAPGYAWKAAKVAGKVGKYTDKLLLGGNVAAIGGAGVKAGLKKIGMDEDSRKLKTAKRDARAARMFGMNDKADAIEAKAIEEHKGNFTKMSAEDRMKKLKEMRGTSKEGSLAYKAVALAAAEGGDFINGDHKLDQVAGLDAKFKKQMIKASNTAGGDYTVVPDGGDVGDVIKSQMASGQVGKLFSNIDTGVKMTRDLDGNEVMADKNAVEKLMAMDKNTFDSRGVGQPMRDKIQKALLLAMKNTQPGAERDRLLAKFNELEGNPGAPTTHTVDGSGTINNADLALIQNKAYTGQQSGLASSYAKEVRKEKGSIGGVDKHIGDSLSSFSGTTKGSVKNNFNGLSGAVSVSRKDDATAVEILAQKNELERIQTELTRAYLANTGSTGLVDFNGKAMSHVEAFKKSTVQTSMNNLSGALQGRARLADQRSTAVASGRPDDVKSIDKQIAESEKYIATLKKQMDALAHDAARGRSSGSRGRAKHEKVIARTKFSDDRVRAKIKEANGTVEAKAKLRAVESARKEMETTIQQLLKASKNFDPSTQKQIDDLDTELQFLGERLFKDGLKPEHITKLNDLNKRYENLRRQTS